MFLNAVEATFNQNHERLVWYGQIPEEFRKIFKPDRKFHKWLGLEIEVRPRYSSEQNGRAEKTQA